MYLNTLNDVTRQARPSLHREKWFWWNYDGPYLLVIIISKTIRKFKNHFCTVANDKLVLYCRSQVNTVVEGCKRQMCTAQYSTHRSRLCTQVMSRIGVVNCAARLASPLATAMPACAARIAPQSLPSQLITAFNCSHIASFIDHWHYFKCTFRS